MESDASNVGPAEPTGGGPVSGGGAGVGAIAAGASHGGQGDSGDTRDALAELRYLLVGPERREIAEIREEVARIAGVSVEDVAGVLPQAVRQSERQAITEAMVPVVEESIGLSATRDPTRLADVLFPVMGPAIRKAIREAINSMMQSINLLIEHSVSPRAVQWRLEAWRTGRPFPEIVFRHTMIYKVEQVFLIHRETGLLLQHASAGQGPVKDADVVSGMLTAIQDFVRDSFQTETGDTLDKLHIGDLSVVVEQGPTATVAGVVRGHAPEDLRLILHDALTDIHRKHLAPLRTADVDPTAFVTAKPVLEGCLQFQPNPEVLAADEKRRESLLGRLTYAHWLGIVLLLSLVALGVFDYVRRQQWHAYLARLRAEPGIVVTQAERGWWTHRVDGLRDPLARDPRVVLASSDVDPAAVDSQWKPYLAMEPRFVLARVKAALAPPETVSMAVSQEGVLDASGSAPHRWIADARRRATTLPGVLRFKDDRLADQDLQRVARLREQVQGYNVLFPEGEAVPRPDQRQTLSRLAADAARLAAEAAPLGQTIELEVRGHTDSSGTETRNRALSRRRADRVLAALRASLPPGVRLTAKGVATGDPLRPELKDEDRVWNRRVAVMVTARSADGLAGRSAEGDRGHPR